MEELACKFYKYIREDLTSHENRSFVYEEQRLLKSSDPLFRIIPADNVHSYSSQGLYLYEVEIDADPQTICRPYQTDPGQYETNRLRLVRRLSTLEKDKAIFDAGCAHKHIDFISCRVRYAIYDQNDELLKYMGDKVRREGLYNLIDLSDKILDTYQN